MTAVLLAHPASGGGFNGGGPRHAPPRPSAEGLLTNQPSFHANSGSRAEPDQPAGMGHNSRAEPSPAKRSFQDNADELIRVGRLITSFKRIGLAIRDRRCHRDHLLVLYAIMEKLNEQTGTTFPSRRAIAEQEGLTDRAVENVLYELRLWGYVDWERRAEPHLHRGRLLHYTLPVLSWTDEELTRAILAHREALKARSTPPKVYTSQGVHLPGSTPQGVPKSTSPEVTRNLLREPTNTLSGADAPGACATDMSAEETPAKSTSWKPTRAEIEKGFAEWWAAYPKKEDKGDARKAYERRVTHADPKERATIPQLLTAVKAYPFKSDRQYIKHPATWLNKGSWMGVGLPQPNGDASDASVEAEVQRLANTETGRAMIGDMGHARAVQEIRKDVLRRRGGAND